MNDTTSDLRRAKSATGATVNELREFLAGMKGKSPREMLGAVATSNLGKSLIQASIGVAAAILLLTIVPFALGSMFGGKDKPGTPPAIAAEETAPGTPATPSTPPEPELDPDARALDTLGIGESKDAPLSENPLEDGGDDILDELK